MRCLMQASRRVAVMLMLLAAVVAGRTAAAFDLFSVKEPVYAVVNEVLLVGEAIGHWDRAGTITVHSTLDASLVCSGSFRFTHARRGVATIQCSDGSVGDLEFDALGVVSGHGSGTTSKGPVSFTFGLSPAEATPYLNLPKGKKILVTEDGPKLQDA